MLRRRAGPFMLRAAVDANVLLSALRWGRGTRPILDALSARRFHLIYSEALFDELAGVLSRPAWRQAVAPTDASEWLAIIREAATFVTPRARITVCRDPDDNALLECAVGHADVLVTGDKDLLVLHPFCSLRILKPANFLRLLP